MHFIHCDLSTKKHCNTAHTLLFGSKCTPVVSLSGNDLAETTLLFNPSRVASSALSLPHLVPVVADLIVQPIRGLMTPAIVADLSGEVQLPKRRKGSPLKD